jgi:predicted RNase H-like HicB family nuclease
MKYIFVLRKVEQNYIAYVPDLPGCVASGKTADEARKAMKATVTMHLKGLAADGFPIPQPTVQEDFLDPDLLTSSPTPNYPKPSKLRKLLRF